MFGVELFSGILYSYLAGISSGSAGAAFLGLSAFSFLLAWWTARLAWDSMVVI
jgi:hypothetical protein